MDIDLLTNILKDGKLAIIPTDTIYGLIADATKEDAIKKVYEAKKREKKKPLIILVSSISMLKEYVSEISILENSLIQEFWPGPLTIIFKKKNLSDTLTGGRKEIAVRLPNNHDLLKLIEKLNHPIIATSANLSGEKAITNISLLKSEIREKVSYIYDVGTMNEVASTLIKVENNKIIFIREGTLTEKIKEKFSQNI